MTTKNIAIIGGTGELGSGLARRWARAGRTVVLGSRSADKACAVASELTAVLGVEVAGASNRDAAQVGEIVVIAVPWSNHDATLSEIAEFLPGKIVVDAVVPLVPPKVSTVQLPDGGSAAQRAQSLLGPSVRVVGGFHNVGAKKLLDDEAIECDVLVCGDDKEARQVVITLARDAGMRGIDAGALANVVACEALTSILIGINRTYKVTGAGIRIMGIPELNG